MVGGASAADHRGMTTEQPTAPRLLRRRGDDRVLGGVASGLADYFNVDPLLIRIGFVGLMVFNGLGLGLYLLAWLLVPTDTDNQSVVQRIIGRIGGAGALVLGLVALAIILVLNVPSRVVDLEGGGGPGGVEFAVIALIAIAIGAILFRRPEPRAAAVATDADAAAVDATPVAAPPRSSSAAPRVRPRRSAGMSSARCSSASASWRWRPLSPDRPSISGATSGSR